MHRNTLLKSSRVQFTSMFNELIDAAVHQSVESLFEKADKSLNSQEQRQILDARSLIVRNEKILAGQIKNNLEILLDRSFQTAYDQFRPSFFNSAKASPIVLLDISAFDDDLRLEIITSRFRCEAGEQLRDLTIRIAILFERNDIAGHENPFRPYLLTRAIVSGVEASHVEAGLFVIITDQFAEELLRSVVKLYERVNVHLSEAGVAAAQLHYKPQRSYEPDSGKEADALIQVRKPLTPGLPGKPDSVGSNDVLAVSNQFARIEQLLSIIKLRQQAQQNV